MIYKVSLNGKIYEVEVEKGEAVIKSEFDAALPQAAPATPVATPAVAVAQASAPQAAPAGVASAAAITAQVSGDINAIKVTSGQVVKSGDVLLILEAMKMENEIVAPKDGKIGQIFVQKGASVEIGTPLIEVL